MRHYLKFAGLFYGSIALAMLVIGFLAAVSPSAGFIGLVFVLLTAFVALVIGAVVFLIHGVRCARHLADPLHRIVVVLAAPVLTIAVLVAMLPMVVLGYSIGDQANWDRYRPRHVAPPPIRVVPAPEQVAE